MSDTNAINAIAVKIKDFHRKADIATAAAVAHQGKADKKRERATTLSLWTK
jgi:hypothetical protein